MLLWVRQHMAERGGGMGRHESDMLLEREKEREREI